MNPHHCRTHIVGELAPDPAAALKKLRAATWQHHLVTLRSLGAYYETKDLEALEAAWRAVEAAEADMARAIERMR